ncbi:MAG: type II toxin-antitoxin system prevent-host-death family antitoxin [Oscillospiraceae bacterium]|nr:type II toxin-antitoxin system prevent-host-death family antitoxin [Oscillospiraceae bacterium]
MTQISVSELKANTGKYVSMVGTQDIYITQNGRLIARLTTAKPDKVEAARSLFGLLHAPIDPDAEKEERLS